ncbi:HoxN/HupN/NixA family nickel/cobalt transporter [Streptomyces sp. NBC_01428]|uniref:HoxN/HupN/NixA family nickel/cobalt transporter n=1 Tax=Streptomyces sp. NBC_01428 TaxID=2903861 RepID=UPI002E34EA9E|nr:sulfite exporter TauE/SafE family protein [Streptomyces sp. NBC_01428]
MTHTLRRAALTAALVALASAGGLPSASAAPAHPLGNFTVNYHTGLSLRPDRLDAEVVVDRAEISTLQERAEVDADHDGAVSPGERRSYAEASCTSLGRQLHTSVAGTPVRWGRVSAGMTYEPGEAGLRTSRLTCAFTTAADLSRPTDVDVRTAYDSRRIGWREMTVRGHGVRATGTGLPAVSPTDELRHYPRDPAAAPLDQRTARMRTTPGESTAAGPGSTVLPGTGWFGQALGATSSVFDSLVGSRELTVPVGLLALLLAFVLGASHAVLPGHGKTIMASYLAGRRGTRRDAVTVGATVTLTHTAGVLVLGLALPAATHLAGETVLNVLGGASGLIVTGIGLWLLTSALRDKPRHGHHHHHGAAHGHHHHGDATGGHHHGHGHSHSHDGHGHGHDDHGSPGDDHDHGRPSPTDGLGTRLPRIPRRRAPRPAGTGVATLVEPEATPSSGTAHHPAAARRTGRGGLIGMGIAGGLVPSPSALVVLLGAVALGRTAFGVLLVFAYGLGMAATLTLVGLLLVRLRERLESRLKSPSGSRHRAVRALTRLGPAATALLVVIVGFGLTLRAVSA